RRRAVATGRGRSASGGEGSARGGRDVARGRRGCARGRGGIAPVQSLAAAVQRHARTRTADRAEAPHSSALPHGGGGTVARELGYPYRAVRTVATMIQASEYLSAQLHELHVEPAYERRLRVLLEYCRRGLP